MSIPPETLRKVAAIIPRLGSNHDGEIIAAAKALERTLASAGQGFFDLADTISPPLATIQPVNKPATDWKQTARWCSLHGVGILNERELQFVDNLASSDQRRRLTTRQSDWLKLIASRLSMRGAA